MIHKLLRILGNSTIIGTVLAIAILYGIVRLSDTFSKPKYDTPASNLLPNGSFEQIDASGKPNGWKITGSQAEYSIEKAPGIIGKKALKIVIPNYSQGNVSIESPQVQITPNHHYFIKNYLVTNVRTTLIIRFTDANGVSKRLLLKQYLADEEDWSSLSASFIAPNDAATVSFIIEIGSSGYVTLGGSYLIETNDQIKSTITDPIDQPNMILNPNVEEKNKFDQPTTWSTYTYGENISKFSYANTDQNHFLQIDVTDYKNGEAKWQYTPLKSSGNKKARFELDYQSNTTTSLIAEYSTNSGNRLFSTLTTLPPTQEWTHFSVDFATLPDIKDITVTGVIESKGYLKTDNYALVLTDSDIGFDRPLISITFDDGWKSQATTALPILKKYGFNATFYVNPTTIGTQNYLHEDDLINMLKNGFEIGSHSYHHTDTTLLPQNQLTDELQKSADYLSQYSPYSRINFAAPYGKHDELTDQLYAKYFVSNRGTDTGVNTRLNFDQQNLKVFFVKNDTPLASIENQITQTTSTKGWLILVYHNVGTEYRSTDISEQQFTEQLQMIKNHSITVMSVQQGLAEILPQLNK
ncbi:polysaccharide deacetylase family protein [candidate division WWE3 bacterium]|nr:polysaccharide deacetylase family protein [candidate division WWE3 bacterium]